MEFNAYQIAIIERDYCQRKATEYEKAGDIPLARFYSHAAEGFNNKARAMTLEQAQEVN